MHKLIFFLTAVCIMSSCGNTKKQIAEEDDEPVKKTKVKPVVNDEEIIDKPEGGWSAADKSKLKAEWAKTFASMKEELQGEDGFDEAAFNQETKSVVACTLDVLQNKFSDYSAYKEASNKDHFQSDPALLDEMGNCTDRLMRKYNQE